MKCIRFDVCKLDGEIVKLTTNIPQCSAYVLTYASAMGVDVFDTLDESSIKCIRFDVCKV